MKELFADRNVDIPAIQQRLQRVADSLGLPLVDRPRISNSRRAQELAKWAESKGRGDEFHNALFRAYFAQGKNIGSQDELVSIAASVGLSGDEARNAVGMEQFRTAVDADWSRARALRITAVPTFITDDRKAVGFQSYEALAQLLGLTVEERASDE